MTSGKKETWGEGEAPGGREAKAMGMKSKLDRRDSFKGDY